jgi:hypothetical protein
MKIYAIHSQGETDWIHANTIFEALRFYNSINDMEINDFDDGDDIDIVPEEKWKEMIITDPDDFDENENPKVLQTFAEFMEGESGAGFVASTVY